MNKIRISAAVVGASALAATMAFTLPAATAASRSGSPPPAGTVRLTGGLRLDPALPAALLPARWSGLEAARLFAGRRERWSGGAQLEWKRLNAPPPALP